MKVIISPAKKIKNYDLLEPVTLPALLDKTAELVTCLRHLSYSALRQVLGCNEKLARAAYHSYSFFSMNKGLSPALFSYDGIQYSYLAPAVMDENELEYVNRHIFILSALYGALRPLDGIRPYRLDFTAKIPGLGTRTLYEFWDSDIYREVSTETSTILNLSSSEYSRTVEKFIGKGKRFVDVRFYEKEEGRLTEKGVYCKMARGTMVRFLAANRIERVEEILSFTGLGYRYEPELSTRDKIIFIRERRHEC